MRTPTPQSLGAPGRLTLVAGRELTSQPASHQLRCRQRRLSLPAAQPVGLASEPLNGHLVGLHLRAELVSRQLIRASRECKLDLIISQSARLVADYHGAWFSH